MLEPKFEDLHNRLELMVKSRVLFNRCFVEISCKLEI